MSCVHSVAAKLGGAWPAPAHPVPGIVACRDDDKYAGNWRKRWLRLDTRPTPTLHRTLKFSILGEST